MPGPLQLELSAYRNPNEWQWTLFDSAHTYLADHTVRINLRDPQARAFADPLVYVRRLGRVGEPSEQLVELGAWMGEHPVRPAARRGSWPMRRRAVARSICACRLKPRRCSYALSSSRALARRRPVLKL